TRSSRPTACRSVRWSRVPLRRASTGSKLAPEQVGVREQESNRKKGRRRQRAIRPRGERRRRPERKRHQQEGCADVEAEPRRGAEEEREKEQIRKAEARDAGLTRDREGEGERRDALRVL